MNEARIEFRDPATLPQASYSHHPVDDIEPELTDSEIMSEAAEAFSKTLYFMADGRESLVQIGLKALTIISYVYPEFLVESGPCKWGEVIDCAPLNAEDVVFARLFRRVWSWMIEDSRKASNIGMRAIVLLYTLRPDLLGGATMEELGESLNGSSRQNVSKLVSDCRDIFDGIRSGSMRDEITRLRCAMAQGGAR